MGCLPAGINITAGVPQIADDFAATPKSPSLGQYETSALFNMLQWQDRA
jgi:hypothetical protein